MNGIENTIKRKEFTPKKEDEEGSRKKHNNANNATRNLFKSNEGNDSGKVYEVIIIDDGDSDSDSNVSLPVLSNNLFNVKPENQTETCPTLKDGDSESASLAVVSNNLPHEILKQENQTEFFSDGDDQDNDAINERNLALGMTMVYGNDVEKDQIEYFKDRNEWPIFSENNPILQEIFALIMLPKQNDYICKKRPLFVNKTGTFIIDQELVKLNHPFDLDADESIGAASKKEYVRFYEVEKYENSLAISSEIKTSRDKNDKIIGGYVNIRSSKQNEWNTRKVDLTKMFALIRRRAQDKIMKDRDIEAIRWITYIMPINEYNKQYKLLKTFKRYKLVYSTILVHYNFSGEVEEMNAISKTGKDLTSTFRPTMHSVKLACKEAVVQDQRPPRFIIDNLEAESDFLIRQTESEVPRNAKQISNFRQKSKELKNDDYLSVLAQMLDSSGEKGKYKNPFDQDQPFIREFMFESGGHSKFVLYSDQMLKDIQRFCVSEQFPSPLAADTTFNIGEYYFTQTTYKNLSLIQTATQKNPWFPGPLLVHRRQRKEDFSYFWQAVVRGNDMLRKIKVLGTDECDELYNGILENTEGNTIHLLCVEHVKKNIEKKLKNINIPKLAQKIIFDDLFSENGLINSSSTDIYDEKLTSLIEKWNNIERTQTKNNPPNLFSTYFLKHKADVMKTKMTRFVLKKVGLEQEYTQNSIEWLNYMVKSEIDSGIKDSHKSAPLNEIFEKLKKRSLRMYTDATKAIYCGGKYKLAEKFKVFRVDYEEWMRKDATEKNCHLKSFFEDMGIESQTISPEEEHDFQKCSNNTITNEIAIPVNNELETSTQATINLVVSSHARQVCITPEALNIDPNLIPQETLVGIFNKANRLLSDPDGVQKAASDDKSMRTVKSQIGAKPHFVKQRGKNKHALECDCRVFGWYNLCAHTLASSVDLGICFDYLTEVKKKLSTKKSSLTTAIDANRSLAEKGLKKNEIKKKAAASKRRKPANQQIKQVATSTLATNYSNTNVPSTPTISPSSVQVPAIQNTDFNSQSIYTIPFTNQQVYTTQTHPSEHQTDVSGQWHINNPSSLFPLSQSLNQPLFHSTMLNQCSSLFPISQSVNQQVIPNDNSLNGGNLNPSEVQQWHSGMSPHRYYLVEKPAAVQSCYGCHEAFAGRYNVSPYNLIVRHVDRRIRGKSNAGEILYNSDFTAAYYHPIRAHLAKKNPNFDGNVFITKSLLTKVNDQFINSLLKSCGLNPIYE